MERKDSNTRDQQDRQNKPGDANTEKQEKQEPTVDKAHRSLSEIDRREGEMDHGETGGNFRDQQ